MEFRILGPLEALEEGRPIALTGSKQRALLAILLLHAPAVVSRDRLIGIDAWGLDRAVDVMVEDAKAGRAQVWESHLLGREKEYLQIERLANLDQLPSPTGFTVYAFPFKLERASAGWARVVAIFE